MPENLFRNIPTRQVAFFPRKYHGHISNPGMGIISMAISDHMVTGYTPADRSRKDMEPNFTLTKDMLRKVLRLPFIDNIYIRAAWKDVQKEPGRLCLSPSVEMAIKETVKAGKSLGLRVMSCSPSNPDQHLVPESIADKMRFLPMAYPDLYYGPSPKLMPDYTENYMKYWDELLHLLGERLDTLPNLQYVDLSGFGLWGEGHHGSDDHLYTEDSHGEILQRLINSHQNAFRNTPMVVNLHMIEKWKAGQRALAEGCWVRRDSYYDYFKAHQAIDGLNRHPDAGMIFETIIPGCGAPDKGAAFSPSNLNCAYGMCDYGAHFATVGFNCLDTLYAAEHESELFTVFSENIGYRLRPSIIWQTMDDKKQLILGIVNDGAAAPPGKICIEAESNGHRSSTEADGGRFGQRMQVIALPLPDGHDRQITLKLWLTLGQKTYPVRIAADIGSREAPYELKIYL